MIAYCQVCMGGIQQDLVLQLICRVKNSSHAVLTRLLKRLIWHFRYRTPVTLATRGQPTIQI